MRKIRTAVGVMIAFATAIACGASSEPTPGGAAVADSPDGGEPGTPGLGGRPSPLTDAACASSTARAQRMPLDLHIMVDASSSMSERTSSGATKWDALKAALGTFFGASQSAGLHVALTFFPVPHPGVPDVCVTTASCNGHGPCERGVCTGSTPQNITYCSNFRECGAGGDCMPFGTCQGSEAACFAYPGMPPCAGGATCVRDSDAICQDRYSCQKASYTTPAQSADLPAGRASLEAALGARSPEGDTPTAAALTGVLEEALASRAAAPDHAHAVIFITDGLPVRCAPLDTPSIASIAGAALSSDVRTYAVGVFSAADRPGGQALLDALASAGGTTKPFVIDGTKDVSAPLGDALQAIRGSAIPCDYAIPAPPTGAVDPAKVNVEVDLDGRTGLIPQARAGCGTEAGWTYDKDPADGAPSRVRMCPSTCAALVKDPRSVVRVTLGCDTVVR